MRKKIQALLKNEKGFTLVELLAVIVILGIIAAIAIPSIANIIDNSKKDAHVANAEQMISAARMAVAANDKDLWTVPNPAKANTDGTTNITMNELVDNGYLESGIKDPDTGAAYTTAQTSASVVTITTTGTTKTYNVFLDGTDRNVEGSAAGTVVAASALSRASVK